MCIHMCLVLVRWCISWSLLWRYNEHYGVWNHQPRDCLLNRLFRRRSKKTPKLPVTGLCAGNSPETDEFPAQKASNAENVSIWWRHHVCVLLCSILSIGFVIVLCCYRALTHEKNICVKYSTETGSELSIITTASAIWCHINFNIFHIYVFIYNKDDSFHMCSILVRVDNQKLLTQFHGFETARDFEKWDCHN